MKKVFILIFAFTLAPVLGFCEDADYKLFYSIKDKGTEYFEKANDEILIKNQDYLLELLRMEEFSKLSQELTEMANAEMLDGTTEAERLLADSADVAYDLGDKIYLDKWAEEHPDDAWAYLMRAKFFTDKAWLARGNGYASTVSQEGQQTFDDQNKLFVDELKKALAADPSNVITHILLVTWAKDSGHPTEAFKYFEQGDKVSPGNILLHWRMFMLLRPRWYGNKEVMFGFLRQQSAKYPHIAYGLGLAHEDIAGKCGRDEFYEYFRQPEVWEEIFAAYKVLIRKYPKSHRRRIQLFEYAVYASKLDELYEWYEQEGLV